MSAVISQCEAYRYRLERDLGSMLGGKTVAFIMVNPSTADAVEDDQTIKKVCGFARLMGGSRVIVGNLFAWRAKDITALRGAADPVGPENDAHLIRILTDAEITVVAWGALSKLPPQLRARWMKLANMAGFLGVPLHCLGTAKDGHPLHPCMIGYERPVLSWAPPAIAIQDPRS